MLKKLDFSQLSVWKGVVRFHSRAIIAISSSQIKDDHKIKIELVCKLRHETDGFDFLPSLSLKLQVLTKLQSKPQYCVNLHEKISSAQKYENTLLKKSMIGAENGTASCSVSI